jgi:hypothetical protein
MLTDGRPAREQTPGLFGRSITGTGSVTRGAVRAGPADRPADLAAGDSIHHDAAQPHIYQGLEPENHALLLMIYPR